MFICERNWILVSLKIWNVRNNNFAVVTLTFVWEGGSDVQISSQDTAKGHLMLCQLVHLKNKTEMSVKLAAN